MNVPRHQRGGFVRRAVRATSIYGLLWLAFTLVTVSLTETASVTFKHTANVPAPASQESGPYSGEVGAGPCDLFWVYCWQRT
jgi:hypothetical protein